ncbi:MAG: inner membrane protein YiaA [Anaerolineae bacterium]
MNQQQPSSAFVFAAWAALITGMITFLVGLWNAEMLLSEKGFYFTVLMFGLFGAISVQKSVRDQLEDIPVTTIYYGLSWVATLMPVLLLTIGLWNADLLLSEKGFYGISFILSMFAAVVVQKNTRDAQLSSGETTSPASESGPMRAMSSVKGMLKPDFSE